MWQFLWIDGHKNAAMGQRNVNSGTKSRIMKRHGTRVALFASILLYGCSASRSIGRIARAHLLQSPDLAAAQVGISIYDPSATTFLYDHQGDKYFIPASNTKLFTTYAGLKYLGDSLVGLRYLETDTAVFLMPSGDPTLLHPSYTSQPVINFLQRVRKRLWLTDANWRDRPLGRGWAWDDYNDDYAAERSPLPVYGNTIHWVQEKTKAAATDPNFEPTPNF